MSDNHMKIVIIGDGAIGKTCMLFVYASEDHHFPDSYEPTVFDNYNCDVMANNKKYTLSLWDTAGQEDYGIMQLFEINKIDELRPLSYNNTKFFLVCYSVVDPVSYKNVRSKWGPELKKYIDKNESEIILVGLKTDLRNDVDTLEELRTDGKYNEPLRYKDGVELARKIGAIKYVECSAKTNHNVKGVFDECVNFYINPPKKDFMTKLKNLFLKLLGKQ